ncbi:Uncharacterized protein GcC1_133001 [Golovinomyces cichoracearum]|uniref:Calcium permeable stress-gated cation channel 1 n=1 Tax=Golovinomyces cichoracearum TaxID=62708 RepID=A0A420I3P1_9PEZI|nr:Uncharacterized protein GcC1_133001 [Golovinomyces cichoracearum]
MRVSGIRDVIHENLRRTTGASELLELLKNPYQAQLAQISVIASFGTSIGLTALLAIGFSLLRPYNSVVYAPKLKIAGDKHAPPPLGKEIFAWVKPLLETTEQELVFLIGLDAVVFLRILAMCRNIFVATAIVGCCILVPINLANGTERNVKFIVKVTPINTFGQANWGMAICAWIFNIIIASFLWWNYRAILSLRRTYYDSTEYQSSLHARTLMLNDIPKEYRSDEGINRLIDKVAPTSSFSRTAIARNVKELPELIEEHNETVKILEKCLAKYMRNPKKLPVHRPKCYPTKDDPARSSYPKGHKQDAIEYLTSRIKELELNVREVRMAVDNRNPLPYGFATYDSIEECHSIAFAAKNKHPQGTTIVLAPRPNDIIWRNMPLTKAQRRTRRTINNMWVTLLTILWAAPNALISIFLTSLANLGHVWQDFQNSLAANTNLWSLVQGVASPAVTSLVYLVLPIIFRRLAVKAGDRTKTARERHVAGKLYTFFVFNFLIVFSMFSTVWNFVSTIINATNSGTDAWKAISDADYGLATFISLCDISPFWITWLLQRNLGAAVDFAQLWTLVWSTAVRNFSSPTPRELIELTAPQAFDYASYYNYFLFYSTVTLCFAFIQPLVLPACALYFVLDFYLKKYLLLYIFVTKIESGGMFWRMFYNRMVFAAILSNFVVFLSLWVHGDGQHTEAFTIVPLPIMMLAFKFYCKKTFDNKIHYYTSQNKHRELELGHSNKFDKKDRLATRFVHPALYRSLITPMVHAKAQNILASVYSGRLSDSNITGSFNTSSVSGYSDAYVLNNIKDSVSGHKSALSGFEVVPENRLDFSHYNNRHEFATEHGGSSEIFGRSEDQNLSDTLSAFGSDSDPGTPNSRKHFASASISSFEGTCADRSEYRNFIADQNEERRVLVRGVAKKPLALPIVASNIRIPNQNLRSYGHQHNDSQVYGKLSQDIEHNSINYDQFRRGTYNSHQ